MARIRESVVAEDRVLEEVVVTAQKRAKFGNVPVAKATPAFSEAVNTS